MHLGGSTSRRVAAYAVGDIVPYYPHKKMQPLDVGRVMAVVAGIGLVVAGDRVTRSTGDNALTAMIQREDVLERGRLPGVGIVAGRTVSAKRAPVGVIFGVAADAGLGRAFVNVVGVAVGAGHLGVFAGQSVVRVLVVVKGRRFPVLRRVALRAVGAQHQAVGVLLHVAGDAGLRRAPVDVVCVALLAGDIDVFAGQLIAGQAVVEDLRLPAVRVVAAGAVVAEIGRVLVILLVATHAVAGRLLEAGQVSHARMAVGTRHAGVLAGQRVSGQVVVELALREGIGPVVAGLAIGAEVAHVRGHEIGLVAAVARLALGGLEARQALGMAVGAADGPLVGGGLVAGQAELELLVVDDQRLDLRERGLWAAVFGMASPAILGLQHTVERVGVRLLAADSGVAGQAAVGHGLPAPGGGVTGGAVGAQGGMRIGTTQDRPGWVGSAERSGTENLPTPCQDYSGHHK
jgi:hypothetical protein